MYGELTALKCYARSTELGKQRWPAYKLCYFEDISLGDIGVPPLPDPMDFSAWFEVFLGGRWYSFDARHNQRRIGRIVIGRGRDAVDVPITMVFGSHQPEKFSVVTEELKLNDVVNRGMRSSCLQEWKLTEQLRVKDRADRIFWNDYTFYGRGNFEGVLDEMCRQFTSAVPCVTLLVNTKAPRRV
jgi:hypothetical protein